MSCQPNVSRSARLGAHFLQAAVRRQVVRL